MRTPKGHKIQRSTKCAIAHEQTDDKADVVLLDAYLYQKAELSLAQ